MDKAKHKAGYKAFYAKVSALFCRYDPIGICGEDNPDEYDLEVDTVLPRLKTCLNAEDVRDVLHEEFVRWFDADIAGPQERYAPIAEELWQLWLEYRDSPGAG